MTNQISAAQGLKFEESQFGILRPESRRLVTVCRDKAWGGTILGRAPIPCEPVRLANWMIVPVQQDTSQIPARTLERVQAIYTTGLRPKGFVLVHEAPKLLPGAVMKEPRWRRWASFIPASFHPILKIAAYGLAVTLGLMAVVALAVGLAVLLMSALFMLAMLAVPLVIMDPRIRTQKLGWIRW